MKPKKQCLNCFEEFEQMPFEFTCSTPCHEAYVEKIIQNTVKILGTETKIITDAKSGIKYLVPIRDILVKGVKYHDLPSYPLA